MNTGIISRNRKKHIRVVTWTKHELCLLLTAFGLVLFAFLLFRTNLSNIEQYRQSRIAWSAGDLMLFFFKGNLPPYLVQDGPPFNVPIFWFAYYPGFVLILCLRLSEEFRLAMKGRIIRYPSRLAWSGRIICWILLDAFVYAIAAILALYLAGCAGSGNAGLQVHEEVQGALTQTDISQQIFRSCFPGFCWMLLISLIAAGMIQFLVSEISGCLYGFISLVILLVLTVAWMNDVLFLNATMWTRLQPGLDGHVRLGISGIAASAAAFLSIVIAYQYIQKKDFIVHG